MFDSRPPPCQTRLPCTHHICPLRPCAFRNKPLTHPPCPRVCTAILTCGLHHCTLQCHPKKCPPCTKLNQYTCPCGNMKAGKGQCGITCTMICTAPTNCIHNNEPHMCHPEEIQCPECHMPTNKICLCGKGKVIARYGFRIEQSRKRIIWRLKPCIDADPKLLSNVPISVQRSSKHVVTRATSRVIPKVNVIPLRAALIAAQ